MWRTHDGAPRLHPRPLARGAGARHYADHLMGYDLLYPGAARAADRGGSRLVDRLRHGGIFVRAAHGWACRTDGRTLRRPFRRTRGDDRRLVDRRAWPRPYHPRRPSFRLSGGVGDAWARNVGEPLRFRFRQPRTHLWRRGAPADHRSDPDGRFRLDGKLAGDAFPA